MRILSAFRCPNVFLCAESFGKMIDYFLESLGLTLVEMAFVWLSGSSQLELVLQTRLAVEHCAEG